MWSFNETTFFFSLLKPHKTLIIDRFKTTTKINDSGFTITK